MLVTPDTSRASTREEFALALFVKSALHAFTVTLGVEAERLPTMPAINQVQLTRRARSEEPGTAEELQEEMDQREIQTTAGGGIVSVTMTGNQEITTLTIDPAAVDPDDVEMLQDLVQAAVNEAVRESRQMMKDEMAKITGGLPVPGMF